MKRIILTLTSLLVVLSGIFVPSALAEEIVVTGNGADSANVVTVDNTQNTTVTQSNDANITNNVTADANTGGNEASNNTGGDTNISTGDTTTSVGVSNEGNVSVAQVGGCDCPSTSSNVISGNGAGSTNTVNNVSVNNTNVTTNNTADVTNNVTLNANTGNNTANFNNGDVRIATGNITAKLGLLNAFNFSKVKISQGKNVDSLLKIAGNGVSSVNTINNVDINNVNVMQNNIANFLNNIIANLNTGNNTANFNNGNVDIKTGDVWAEIKVTNLANVNEVLIDCGCKPKPGEQPPIIPPGVTTTPTTTTTSPSPAPQPSVQGIAAALGEILPATGSNWLLFALLANIGMFFLGAYLRLRSGRSPGLVFAK